MKQLYSRIFSAILLLGITFTSYAQSIIDKVGSLPNVSNVQLMESKHFNEKFVAYFEQPIDHNNPEKGTFLQRVFIFTVHPDSATVVVTEGYGAQYAARPSYRDEISTIFNTNLVFVEHRYFLESTPKGKDWTYLTAENSAKDLHNVVTSLKPLLPKKWIATGVSKGGQTAMLYRTFFPKDVDITVPYVAPLCRGKEDGRHEPFIANFAGTPQDRATIKGYQIEVLKRKATLVPMLEALSKEKGLEYNLPLKEIFDYCVLEFPFAFWQWGMKSSTIPALTASDKELFDYLVKVAGPDYFVKESDTSPFFVQAAKELGYYGYDTKPFKKYLDIKSSKGYLDKIFLPKDNKFKFDKTLYNKISSFLKTTDSKMLFIYGEFDPWSAVRVPDSKRENIKIYIEPNGSHRARIRTFPEETSKEIISVLSNWLYQ